MTSRVTRRLRATEAESAGSLTTAPADSAPSKRILRSVRDYVVMEGEWLRVPHHGSYSDSTPSLWVRRVGRPVSTEEERTIRANLVVFFGLLAAWDRRTE